jgi:methionine-rich copper-binding protein CopC
LDQQVYAPGEVVHAVFTSETPGTLTATSFDETHTITISTSGTADFFVPQDTTGGTYGVGWEFVPADTTQTALSGAARFDVSGLIVKTAKCWLEKGKYAPGETIKAEYIFESNMDATLTLRCWTTTPSGGWTYLGENSIALSSTSQVTVQSSYDFSTVEAGTHNLVYGLYREDALVVSGSMAFDVGDAVLLGLGTDRFEYKEGNENVTVKIDYFGSGTAQMELILDGEPVDNRSISIDGVGGTEIVLNNSQVSGGSHSLTAGLTKDGLISEKSTGFIYGTNLPDLSLSLTGSEKDGLNYTFRVEVANSGKTASMATDLLFSDNGASINSLSVPALQPGTSYEAVFSWSGSGQAGSHEFVFTVDSNDTVKEFSESNNSLTFSEEVPLLFYSLSVEPEIWPGNSQVNIMTRLINNQSTAATLNLDLSITSDSSSEVIFQRTKTEELPAFGSRTISDMFNTSVYPAGSYTLSQDLSSANIDLTESIPVIIEVTKAITASLTLSPERIPAETDAEMELTMNLMSASNVPLEDETLSIEVVNKDTDEVVETVESVFSLQIVEEETLTKTVALNLIEGNYEMRLKYFEEELAAVEFQAIPAIEKEKSLYIKPRILLMNLNRSQAVLLQSSFLIELFTSQGIEHERAEGVLDAYLKLHKGQGNINVVFGNLESRHIAEEMRERVYRGEGLILFCDTPVNNPEMVELLGVKVESVPGKQREQDMEILTTEISAPGEFQLVKRNKLSINPQKEDVVIVGRSMVNKIPVMALRKYGSGYILTSAMPLQFNSGAAHIVQLLINAITHFNRDVYSLSDLTRILPILVSITNKSSAEKELIIKELLPYGATAFDYDPKPEEGDELQWKLKIPAGDTSLISYWLKLPDEINDYKIKTEIYEQDTLMDEVSFGFSVAQKLLSRIDEIIVEIDEIETSGQDAQNLRKAKQKLGSIRSRGGDSPGTTEANLIDAVQAANYIGDVQGVDVSILRLKVQNVMIALGRIYYEAFTLATTGSPGMASLLPPPVRFAAILIGSVH